MQIKHLAFFSIITTFSLLLLGGVVHNTESSLACPDWPLCYGQFFPEMKGGVLIEHSHRLLASFVGLLTIGLTFLGFKRRQDNPMLFRLCWISLAMVILQGILGGITVIYRLPTIVSTTHLGLSLIFFCTLVLIYHKAKYEWFSLVEVEKGSFEGVWSTLNRHLVGVVIAVLYAQIMLGAFLRHSGAGAACGLGKKSALLCTDTATWAQTLWPSLAPAQLHMFHRYMAVVVTLLLTVVLVRVCKMVGKLKVPKRERTSIYFLCGSAFIVVLLQVTLGIMTVISHIGVVATTLHLGGGALLLALLWKIYLNLKTLESNAYGFSKHSFISDLVDLTKPKLSALVMLTVFVGMLMTPEHVHFFRGLGALILIAFVVMGGAALNCYLEKDVDAMMERTKDRPLPAGRMSAKAALFFGSGLSVISIVGLMVLINIETGLLALLSACLYLFVYTPMKRKSIYALFLGAIPGAIPAMMGWTVVMGKVEVFALLLFLIVFLWQIPHFLAISIYHSEDYAAGGIQVFPHQFGDKVTRLGVFFGSLIVGCSALLPGFAARPAYLPAAIVLSVVLVLFAAPGLSSKINGEELKKWAKRYFWATVVYLPLLLGSLIFFN